MIKHMILKKELKNKTKSFTLREILRDDDGYNGCLIHSDMFEGHWTYTQVKQSVKMNGKILV